MPGKPPRGDIQKHLLRCQNPLYWLLLMRRSTSSTLNSPHSPVSLPLLATLTCLSSVISFLLSYCSPALLLCLYKYWYYLYITSLVYCMDLPTVCYCPDSPVFCFAAMSAFTSLLKSFIYYTFEPTWLPALWVKHNMDALRLRAVDKTFRKNGSS